LAGLGFSGDNGQADVDSPPWGIDFFGHTASGGGIYATIRIPFSKNIKITLQLSPNLTKPQYIFWSVIRGVENFPVILGDLELPRTSRLRLYKNVNVSLNTLDFITLCNITKTGGAVLEVMLAASSNNYGYLEACLRGLIDGATNPIFLSSGTEDYFLSASYYNLGEFKTPNSGLTYFDRVGTMSAYKLHLRDPLLFTSGLQLVWRNNEETTGTGNMSYCPQVWKGSSAPHTNYRKPAPLDTAIFSTYVWVYEYPTTPQLSEGVAIVNVADSEIQGFIFTTNDLPSMLLTDLRGKIQDQLGEVQPFRFMKALNPGYAPISKIQEVMLGVESIIKKENYAQVFIDYLK